MTIDNARASSIDLTLFVACYNEEECICNTLDTLVAVLQQTEWTYEIIVADDASQDTSVSRVQQYQREHPDLPIFLKVNEKNRGLSYNFIDCAFLGRGKYYKLVCGDNCQPADSLTGLIREMGRADIILPYYEEHPGKSALRMRVSRLFTTIVNLLSGHSIRYYNGCGIFPRYLVMRWQPITQGLGFQSDMITRMLDEGFSYREVKCLFIERVGGTSTALSIRNLLSAGHTFFEITCRRTRRWLFTKLYGKKTPVHSPQIEVPAGFSPASSVSTDEKASIGAAAKPEPLPEQRAA